MSEPRALLDAGALSAPDDGQLPDDGPARSRTVVLLAGAGALAVLALGGVLLLGGGTDETDVALTTTTTAAPTAVASPAVTPAASPSAAPQARPARDPFVPLEGPAAEAAPAAPAPVEVEPPAGDLTGGTPVTGGVPVSGGVSVPVVPAEPAEPGGTGTGGTTPGTGGGTTLPAVPEVVAPGRRLALSRVGGTAEARTAVLVLDGTPVTVAVGAAFGADLLLLSVQEGPQDRQWTAVVQRGTGQPFDVVTGAPVTVPSA